MKAYNQVASVYDYMIDWETRLQNEDAFFIHLFREQMTQSILDLGCGTGEHVLHWGEMGHNTTGVDSSKEMIAQAKQKADELDVDVEFLCLPMDQFAVKIEESFDMITCIGNTLPHVLDQAKLDRLFQNIAAKLNPFGCAVFQLHNFEPILEVQKRDFPVKARQENGKEYIFSRFYDYHQEKMLFNLVAITRENGSFTSKSHSVYHYPWRYQELKDTALKAGFKTVMAYGNFQFEEFNINQSSDLILVCDFQEEEPNIDEFKEK